MPYVDRGGLRHSYQQIERQDQRFSSGITIDLGAGNRPRNPLRTKQLFAIDAHVVSPSSSEFVKHMSCDVVLDPIPFDSQSIDVVCAFDFIEHIPRLLYMGRTARFPFIALMNEIHRVLRPGGLLIAVTPAYPRDGAFVDPTHVNFITKNTVNYFADANHAAQLGYGFEGRFEVLVCDWLPYNSAIWKTIDTEEFRTRPDQRPSAFNISRRFSMTQWKRKISSAIPSGSPVSDHLMWVLQRPTERE